MESVTDEEIRDAVLSEYDFHVTAIERLPGYSDLNCQLLVTEEHNNPHVHEVPSDGYLLKLFHSKKTTRIHVIRGWQEEIEHLLRHNLPVPQLTPTISGDLLSQTRVLGDSGIPRVAYMYRYIPGVRMDLVKVTSAEKFFTQIGQLAGRVTTAIKSFSSPVFSTYRTIWRFDSVPDMAKLVEKYCVGDERATLLHIIQLYKDRIIPVLDKLPKGVIHGDVAPQNVLLRKRNTDDMNDYEVTGLIDFSDSAESLYIFEIACTISYMLKLFQDDATCSVIFICREILHAYLSEASLLEEEKRLVQLCILIRLLQLFILGTDVLDRDPGNDYVRYHTTGNLEMIRKLRSISDTDFVQQVF